MVEQRRAFTMMGQQNRKEPLFYYFRLEDQIPETHLLRLIDRHVDFSFVRTRLQSFYSQTGRPSIEPRGPFCVCCWSAISTGSPANGGCWTTVRMHLAYRWFTGLGFGREVT